MPEKHAAEVPTRGQPSTEKADYNLKSQGFPNSSPHFDCFPKVPFLLGAFCEVSSLWDRDDVFGQHGLTDCVL